MGPDFPIYLLRHGQTEWNHDDKRQGRNDSALTQLGLKQAAAMGATLALLLDRTKDWRFSASPQPRAWKTAEIIGAACGLSPEPEERLMEIAMGSWEGLTWPEIDALGPRDKTLKYPQYHIPDGERFEDTAARATSWLESIDRPTIAVSHGMTGLVIRALYLKLDEDGLNHLSFPSQDSFFLLTDGAITEIGCG